MPAVHTLHALDPIVRLEHAELLRRIFDDRAEGRETLLFRAREPLAEVTLDARDLNAGPVRMLGPDAAPDEAGEPCATLYDKRARRLTVALSRPVAEGERFALRLEADRPAGAKPTVKRPR